MRRLSLRSIMLAVALVAVGLGLLRLAGLPPFQRSRVTYTGPISSANVRITSVRLGEDGIRVRGKGMVFDNRPTNHYTWAVRLVECNGGEVVAEIPDPKQAFVAGRQLRDYPFEFIIPLEIPLPPGQYEAQVDILSSWTGRMGRRVVGKPPHKREGDEERFIVSRAAGP